MKSQSFTLIEVIIATLTLAICTVVAVEMSSSTHLNTYDAESQWAREHLTSMACEFYLLFGHEAEFPSEVLPAGYSVSCELNEAIIPEGDLEEKYEPISGWIIGEYTIRLFSEGQEINTVTIDKLVPADYFQ